MTPKVLQSSMAKLCRGANEEVCEGMLVYEFMTRSARMCKNCLERANKLMAETLAGFETGVYLRLLRRKKMFDDILLLFKVYTFCWVNKHVNICYFHTLITFDSSSAD